MAEALSPFGDEQAAIEYAMLWTDVQETINQHAGSLGIRGVVPDEFARTDERTKVVLQSAPNGEHIVQLWGLPTQDQLIGQVTLTFLKSTTQVESHCYELLTNRPTYYGQGVKRTTFSKEELEGLRADLQETTWDPIASEEAAKSVKFWDV